MEFRLLGPLEVVTERGPVDVGSRRQRALLALLALHPNRVVTSERILEALWGDDAADKENAMWVAISRLRSALEPDHSLSSGSVVVTRDHGYVLAVDPAQIDITQFEAHVDTARGLSEHDAAAALEEVDQALALWRGSPIQEFAYEEFAQIEIARLEDRHLEAFELRAEAQLRLGDGREQLATLRALHEQHPLRERFVELYMRSLYQAGRQPDALRAFDRHRRALGEDMGLDVSPELARLEEQILLHDPAVRVLRRTDSMADSNRLTNPFKGLRAFTEQDAADFFGRDRLVSDIVRRLDGDRNLVALVGASGSGKSSIVGAGVIPAVRKGALPGSEDWLVAKMVPGAEPLAELEAALLRSSLDAPDSVTDLLATPRTGLLKASVRILPEGARMVLVIDQFEELFTLVDDEADRKRFLELLGVAVDDPHSRIKVVLTLRADFYEHPLGYPDFARRLSDRIVNVTALTPDEFEAAAQEPMRRAGVGMEPALLASLLADVVGQPGALPLFQYTLTMLFDKRTADLVTLDDYEAMGGLRGAITQRADDLMAELSASEQDIAHQLFLRLVTVTEDGDWSRRRVLASELVSLRLDLVALQRVIEAFDSQRLLALSRDHVTGSPTVEVAHEALISQWPRFRAWIDEDRHSVHMLTHLRNASYAWEAGGEDAGDLYRGARLGAVLDWAETTRPVLSDLETRFLAGAREARDVEVEAERRTLEQRERQNVRLRRLLVVVGTTAVVALVFGGLALQQRQRASDQTRQAIDARTVAETRRLAADAPALAASNRRVALLIAAEAHRRDANSDTLGALQRVLVGTGNLVGYVGETAYESAVWSPDGGLIVGLRADAVDIFDSETGALTGTIVVQTGAAMDVSPAGDTVAVATAGTQVQLFDVTTAQAVGQPLEHGSTVQVVRFSPDGRTFATGDRSGVLRLFDASDQRLLFEVDAHPETSFLEVDVAPDVARTADHEPSSFPVGVRNMAFTPDGSAVATTGGLFIRTWSTADGTALTDTQIHRPSATPGQRFVGRPTEIFLPTGGEAIIRANRFVQRWNLPSNALIDEFELDLSNRTGVVASLDTLGVSFTAERVAVADLDTISILDIDSRDEIVVAFDIQAGSTTANVAFSPDGRTVAVAGTAGIVLWAVDGRELLAQAVPSNVTDRGPLQISSDGQLLAVGSGDDSGDVPPSLWFLGDDQPRELPLPKVGAYRLWLDLPNNVITQVDGVLEAIGTAAGEDVAVEFGNINNFGLAVSPAGDLVAVSAGAPDEPLIHVLESESGRRVVTPIDLALIDVVLDPVLDPPVRSPFGLAFNADGTRLLASTRTGAAAVFDTVTWERIGEPISQGAGRILEAAYSSDGRYLATSDATGAITLRDPDTNQPLGRQFLSSTSALSTEGSHSLAFSADGQYLVSTADGSARLWDVDTGALVGSPIGQEERSNIAPSLNGRWLPVNRGDQILIYDLDVTRWFGVACRAAGRNLTVAEWQQSGPADAEPQQTCPQWAPPSAAAGG